MKTTIKVLALTLLTATAQADYCQFLDGYTKGYLCVPEAELSYPHSLLLIYNGDIDGTSSQGAQFVDYSPLPAKARIEVYVDGRRAFWGTRSIGQRFWIRNLFAESSIEINVWDTDGNYSQFIRLDPTNVWVGFESGGVGVWAGRG